MVEGKTHFGGKIDFGKLKRRTKKITDDIERALSNPLPIPAPRTETAFAGVAPIAAPTGGSSYSIGPPRYGTLLPAKRGNFIMIYALLGLFLFHVLSPAAWIYANRTLKDYGDVDPGDKKLVKTGRIIGIIGTVVLLLIWGVRLFVLKR